MGVSIKQNLVFPDELVLRYSGYWRTWSRVLYMQDPTKGNNGSLWVELNLTPVNPTVKRSWVEQVQPVVLRKHSTAQDPWKDKLFRFVVRSSSKSPLYKRLLTEVGQHVGIPLAHRLLWEDFLPQIDWPAYEAHCNGGCAFDRCRKGTVVNQGRSF